MGQNSDRTNLDRAPKFSTNSFPNQQNPVFNVSSVEPRSSFFCSDPLFVPKVRIFRFGEIYLVSSEYFAKFSISKAHSLFFFADYRALLAEFCTEIHLNTLL